MGVYYAKVVDGVVERVVTVDSFDYIVENPERYGDASLYVESDYSDPILWGAREGWLYDEQFGFRPQPPSASWVWDVANGWWKPPVELPADAKSISNPDGVDYAWDESSNEWKKR